MNFMEIINRLFNKYRQLVLYLIIGGLCASIDYLIFLILTYFFNINYLIANIFSVNAGIITSFILNRNFNFKIKDNVANRFLSFYLVGLFGLLISFVILFAMVELLHYNEQIIKIVSIVIIALIQFLLNKFITFKVKQ